MKPKRKEELEATRLENLWAGDFGDAYTDRNAQAGKGREAFWTNLLKKYSIEKGVLEVGCNMGINLRVISTLIAPHMVFGVDINEKALELLRASTPKVNTIWSPARDLPFRDARFELVFTAGVLIHQPESSLALVMSEIVRCTYRYVLCLEYYASETVAIPYRGQERALFKRDYGRLYRELFPLLQLEEKGNLGKDEGWDDTTFWLFRKKEA